MEYPMFTAFSDDVVMVECTVSTFAAIVLPTSVENPMEPDVIAATPSVDRTMVELEREDTTSVEGMTTLFAESVEQPMFTAFTVDAVNVLRTVFVLLVAVLP